MEIIRELFKKYREQIAYLFFGGMTTAVNWITYALLANIILGEGDLNKSISKAVAWSVAVIFAFFTNKFFVFQHKNGESLAREFLTFFGARVLSGLIEIGGFALLVDGLGFNDWVINVIIAVFVVIANYVLSKFLIFKK